MIGSQKMSKVAVRLPPWIIKYFEKKSEEAAIGKTTLVRKYLIERIKEKEDSLSEIRNREEDNHDKRDKNR